MEVEEGLLSAQMCGRQSEFMAGVNDPCCLDHPVVGTGGQHGAGRVGRRPPRLMRRQLLIHTLPRETEP